MAEAGRSDEMSSPLAICNLERGREATPAAHGSAGRAEDQNRGENQDHGVTAHLFHPPGELYAPRWSMSGFLVEQPLSSSAAPVSCVGPWMRVSGTYAQTGWPMLKAASA